MNLIFPQMQDQRATNKKHSGSTCSGSFIYYSACYKHREFFDSMLREINFATSTNCWRLCAQFISRTHLRLNIVHLARQGPVLVDRHQESEQVVLNLPTVQHLRTRLSWYPGCFTLRGKDLASTRERHEFLYQSDLTRTRSQRQGAVAPVVFSSKYFLCHGILAVETTKETVQYWKFLPEKGHMYKCMTAVTRSSQNATVVIHQGFNDAYVAVDSRHMDCSVAKTTSGKNVRPIL